MVNVYPKSWFECMHLIGQNKHSKFLCNTQCILPVTMSCAVRYADKPTWGCIPQLFATFEPWRRHLRRVTSAKGSQKSEFYRLAFDRTNRQNWVQYFPCKNDLCRAMVPDCLGTLSSTLCQISAFKRQLGNMFLTTPYF